MAEMELVSITRSSPWIFMGEECDSDYYRCIFNTGHDKIVTLFAIDTDAEDTTELREYVIEECRKEAMYIERHNPWWLIRFKAWLKHKVLRIPLELDYDYD